MNDKKLCDGLKSESENLKVLGFHRRVTLESKLERLMVEVETIKNQLERDNQNKLKRQWFVRGWTARNP